MGANLPTTGIDGCNAFSGGARTAVWHSFKSDIASCMVTTIFWEVHMIDTQQMGIHDSLSIAGRCQNASTTGFAKGRSDVDAVHNQHPHGAQDTTTAPMPLGALTDRTVSCLFVYVLPDSSLPTGPQFNRGGNNEANGHTLQDAHDPDVLQIAHKQIFATLRQHTEKKDLQKSPRGFLTSFAAGSSSGVAWCHWSDEPFETESDGHTDHEIKPGHDNVSECNSVPRTVVDAGKVGTDVVDKNHQHNVESTKSIQGYYSLGGFRWLERRRRVLWTNG